MREDSTKNKEQENQTADKCIIASSSIYTATPQDNNLLKYKLTFSLWPSNISCQPSTHKHPHTHTHTRRGGPRVSQDLTNGITSLVTTIFWFILVQLPSAPLPPYGLGAVICSPIKIIKYGNGKLHYRVDYYSSLFTGVYVYVCVCVYAHEYS